MSARFSTESASAGNAQFSFGNGKESSVSVDDVTFLRLPEVKAVTGLSKTTIYERIREADFPSPVPIGKRAVGWIESEIKQWAADRVLASRSMLSLNVGKRPPHSVRREPGTPSRRMA